MEREKPWIANTILKGKNKVGGLVLPNFKTVWYWWVEFTSVAQSYSTLCHPMDCSMLGFPVQYQLLELAQIHVHWVSDAIQLSHPLSFPFLLPSIFRRVFSNQSVLHIRWPKYWSFSFSINPYNEYSGLISFRTDWFDLFAAHGTLKGLLHHHCSKASKLQHSAFFMVQLSHLYMTTRKTIILTRQTFVRKVMSLFFNMLSRLVRAFLPRGKCLLKSFMAAVTICSDTGTRENKVCHFFPLFPHLFAMKWWNPMPWSSFFECWVLTQLFHSPLSLSSRDSLVPLCFLPLHWCHMHIWGYWYFSRQSWFQLVHHPAQHFVLCTLHTS